MKALAIAFLWAGSILLSVKPADAQSKGATALATYVGADREKRLLDAARKEGEVAVYSSMVVEDLNAIAAAFEKKYGIKVKPWRASSEKVLQRVTDEARGNRFDADVIETNGPELESLYREKLLLPARSPHHAELLPAAIPAHGAWVGVRLNMFVHAYNTNLVKKEDLPKTYAQLLDPKWKGKLGIEAEDQDWFGSVLKELGEEKGVKLFKDLVATNGLSVRKGHTQLASLVASGEVPFALTVYNHNADRLKQKGAPIDWYAISPAFLRVNGVSVAARPAHPNAALLFYDFMLSEEGQQMLEAAHYIPVNRKMARAAYKLRFKVIDSATVLDESNKWNKLWDEIIGKAPRG
jgi:iron(III) transport system substrate-binding protein